MAVVIPMAAAYFTVGAGVAAAAAATTAMASLAAYAMVAGGVLTGLGALSGDKDISKIGAILSLGGGLGTAASNAANSANAANAAGTAATASEAGAGSVESLYSPTGAEAGAAADAATAAGGAAPAADAAAAATTGLDDAAFAADLFGDSPAQVVQGSGADGGLFGMEETLSNEAAAGGWAGEGAKASSTPVQEAAKGLTMDDVSGFLKQAAKKVGEGMDGVAPWIKQNKELVQLGGKALSSVYGPEAELVQIKKDQMGRERSLMDRAYANANSPVKLYNYGKGA